MRNWVSSPSIDKILLSAYKYIVTRSSEFVTRLVEAREESWGVAVYSNFVVSEANY